MRLRIVASILLCFSLISFKGDNNFIERDGTDYAVFFAVKDYDQWDDLRTPIQDAQAIAKVLRNKYDFKTEILENPTWNEITDKILALKEMQFHPEDQLMIFFTGHGQFFPSKEDSKKGKGFFIPSDAKKNDKRQKSYIFYPSIKPDINDIGCNHILTVIDACYSGSFLKYRSGGDERPGKLSEREKLINNNISKKFRKGITSGGLGRTKDGIHHSPFTDRFLTALSSQGGEDFVLTYNELFTELESLNPNPNRGYFGDEDSDSKFLFVAKNPKKITAQPSLEVSSNESDFSGYGGRFTDSRDGQSYRWIKMKDGKIWMAENLNFPSKESYCFDDNDKFCDIYGRLYNWEAASNACPKGWHLPTDKEWKMLVDIYGGVSNMETLKNEGDSKSTYKALTTNDFKILLGGSRFSEGNFNDLEQSGRYWSSTERVDGNAWGYDFFKDNGEVGRGYGNKPVALSCRCIKN